MNLRMRGPMSATDQETSGMALPTSQRFRSLDIFRGATIASMVVVNSLGAPADSFQQLLHATWNGWTFADVIFPTFLFIVGCSITLSSIGRRQRGADNAALVLHAMKRTLLIFAAGVAIDWVIFPQRSFPYVGVKDHLQLTGVLQKIAVCYLSAFFIFLWTGWRGVLVAIVALNLLYLGLLYLYPVPGCGPGVLSPECSFPNVVDEILLSGFTSGAVYEPDGLGAILPAISSVLLGVLAGRALPPEASSSAGIAKVLFGGAALALAGVLLSRWIPINKHLWTPSYVALTAGFAAISLASFRWAVDVRGFGRLLKPFEILGLNAVLCYLASRPVDHALRVHFRGVSIRDALQQLASPAIASLLFAMVVLAVVFLGAWFLYRRQWFLRF